MIEVRFHGRGGQGAVIASELLAQAAFLEGSWVQSFPFFGVERRGAPVTAFARIDEAPIQLRTSIEEPDVVVVLDPGLLKSVPVAHGLKERGLLLVNSPRSPAELSGPMGARRATVDANRIAATHGLGSATMPIVNTAMLGALARLTGMVSERALAEAIAELVPVKVSENQGAATDGFHLVRESVVGGVPVEVRPHLAPPAPLPEAPIASVGSDTLRTSAWRTLRPVIHLEKCTKCEFCWKFCPDDAIWLDKEGFPHVREDYCKGCGICAVECPPRTIEMAPEGA